MARVSARLVLQLQARHGVNYRFSLDAELSRHVGSKTEADQEAARIKAAILAGTFKRTGSHAERTEPSLSGDTCFRSFAETYVERVSAGGG
jgi:hypothetical protein